MPPPFDEVSARRLDAEDPLAPCRELFHVPTAANLAGDPSLTGPCVYLVGNSLGLQPKSTRAAVEQELDDWERIAVEAHLKGKHPWLPYHEEFREMGARLVGGVPGEVVMMNSLTVNLHLMMVSFYRPTKERFKIVIEDSAFPSDSYAVQSQAAWHGFDPAQAIIRLKPRNGEHLLRTEDVLDVIARQGREVALVMLGGVNYLTGQWFDMPAITSAGQKAGCIVGWDLAHAAGNVPMRLHDWNVDFACWCSYKYLNSGPGAVAGCFVHERHGRNTKWHGEGSIPRFAGWWGNDPQTRFAMGPDFVPRAGADSWQLSNPPIMAMAPVRASLEIFDRVGMGALRAKSEKLTGYLETLLGTLPTGTIEIITPKDPKQRGCHLSLAVKGHGKALLEQLTSKGVACDFREPNVIRAAPVPLYCGFHDVWRFVEILKSCLAEKAS